MNIAYLLIGGNKGDRWTYLREATRRIGAGETKVIRTSSVYETAAWGKSDQPAFLNQALRVESLLEAPALMQRLLAIEEELGRIRTERYGPRTIDIDMLFYNQDIIAHPVLTIPHPEIARRRFALEPMTEIAPDLIHPVLKKTIGQLLVECPDTLEVKKLVKPQ